LRWVAIHRKHHQFSDERPDPHSPLVDFFWGHMGWLFVQSHEQNSPEYYERYVPDLLRDPYYGWLEHRRTWARIYLLHSLLLPPILPGSPGAILYTRFALMTHLNH